MKLTKLTGLSPLGLALVVGLVLLGLAGAVWILASSGGDTESATPVAPTTPSWTPAAQGASWRPAGFGAAGNFLGAYFDPHQPGVVYAASDVAGLFRSTDAGDTWEMRGVGLGNREISSFAVDPFDPDVLYAGTGAFSPTTKAGLYISRDAGLTWEHLESTYTHTIAFRKYRTIDALAPDPAQPGALLSGSRGRGIWRSTDGGDSWSQVYVPPLTTATLFNDGTVEDDPPLPYPAPVSAIVFDPITPTTVYAGLNGAGVIVSRDRGMAGTWEPISDGLPLTATVTSLAVGDGGMIYAALGWDGVYRAGFIGDWWDPVNTSLPVTGPWGSFASSVAVHPEDEDIVYVTLATYDHANVWRTTDAGESWTPLGDVTYDPVNDPTESWAVGPTMSWRVSIDPHDFARLFFTGYWDIFRSTDGGERWQATIVGAQNTCVTDLDFDWETDALYATHMDAGLLKSTDQGATWEAVLPRSWDATLAGHYWRVAIAGSGAGKRYYTTSDPWGTDYGQVLRSGDGLSWRVVFSQTRPAGVWMGGAMLGLAVDPGDPATLYVTQDGGQVWRSTDGGEGWMPTAGQPGDDAFTYALTVDETGRVFAGTLHGGLWRSSDGGDAWEQVFDDHGSIYHVLAVGDALYATTGDDADLHRSTDGGDTWEPLTAFPYHDDGDGVPPHGMAVAADPNDPDHLLFGRMDTWHPVDAGRGVAESTDGGATWSTTNNGLGHRNVSALAVDPAGEVYAGTWCGGIWRRPAGAAPVSSTTYLPVVCKAFSGVPSPPSLGAVNDFLYQLQDLDLAAIGDTAFDLVIMDYSSDGGEAGEFSAAEIDALKHSPGGEKIVLAYMSVGEAEDYRFYWEDWWAPGNPPWLDVENPDWPGNYKVHYWNPGWQAIVFGYTDRLLDAGFDGAYLDIIDAYEYYSTTRPSAAQDMVDFVAAIRSHAQACDPGFLVFPQNAPELGAAYPSYLTVVDGIGQEEVYYGYEGDDTMTPPTVTTELEGYLDVFKNAGKVVLTTDYATTPDHVDDAYIQSLSKGYVPYVTVRDLDRLVIHPGHEPD